MLFFLLPLSGECRSVAEEEERRFVITGSVCLDKFIVDTDLLSESTNREKNMMTLNEWDIEKDGEWGKKESWSQQSLFEGLF